MIPVNKPYLPNRKAVNKYIDGIYDRAWLTNSGPLSNELKIRLEEYLGVKNLLLVSNGTLALQVAYRALGLSGAAITTPYSFIATASSLKWENINPIFCDIDSNSLNISAELIEEHLTDKVSAIVPVHVYGNPCDVHKIHTVANKHQLKVVYDAAHAFGVNLKGKSILNFGDASTLSFHATKVFHTVEGGGVIFKSSDDYERAQEIINFGLSDGAMIKQLGINAKLSEVNAAFGLSMLDDIDTILQKRVRLFEQYKHDLKEYVQMPKWESSANYNGAYMPILLNSIVERQKVEEGLSRVGIVARRYFFPSLNKVDAVCDDAISCTVSESAAKRVLCLPLYADLNEDEIRQVTDAVKIAMRDSL